MVTIANNANNEIKQVSEGVRLEKDGIPCQPHCFLQEEINTSHFCMVADSQSASGHCTSSLQSI